MYAPTRYFTGLSPARKTLRKKELARRSRFSWKVPRAYEKFKTDKGVKTRKSKYVRALEKAGLKGASFPELASKTGVPLRAIKESYNRGMAAWRTGHRPGATQQQWGYARAYSMLTCGKTHYTADADLVREAKKTRKVRSWFKKTCK